MLFSTEAYWAQFRRKQKIYFFRNIAKLSRINAKLSRINAKFSQINAKLSRINAKLFVYIYTCTCKRGMLKRESFAFIRERFALFRECYAFIRDSFALIRENFALIRKKYIFFSAKMSPIGFRIFPCYMTNVFLYKNQTFYCVCSFYIQLWAKKLKKKRCFLTTKWMCACWWFECRLSLDLSM